MDGLTELIVAIILTIAIFAIGLICNYSSIWLANNAEFIGRKIDDNTNYETIKKVEDTCRSMISSYESDKSIYNTYKNSDNEEKQSWGEQAKMRANKTAITYNEYILKNSFVFENNVPDDIKKALDIIE